MCVLSHPSSLDLCVCVCVAHTLSSSYSSCLMCLNERLDLKGLMTKLCVPQEPGSDAAAGHPPPPPPGLDYTHFMPLYYV